nr:MAG TPA: N-terminal barrel of NtMGAM and CtMGAM, maltase-glucoamylase [Caudoviricetes sp.]
MMKTLITRYPRTTGYALIAALQLTVFSPQFLQIS